MTINFFLYPTGRRLLALAALFTLMSFLSPPRKTTVWLVGDSTMSNKDVRAWPETGWGMPFATFFDSTVIVDNRAQNGRSTRSFIAEQRWQAIMDDLKEGDYVFIQFGHNDEVPTKATYTPEDQFDANLVRFIKESHSKKAIPILITPVARRKFDTSGKIEETHAVYAAIVRKVAAEQQVPLIDLDRESQELLQQSGPENSKLLFNYLAPGQHPNYPEGRQDDTHFNELGARRMAELVLNDIRRLPLGLAEHIVAGTNKSNVMEIDPRPFADNAGHWYAIFDSKNIINALPGRPRYKPTELTNIADNILLFQKNNGGWPKNYDIFAILTDAQKDSVAAAKGLSNTTYDNGSTYTQIAALANVYTATHIEKYKVAALKGLDFILRSQYKNGGWPQYYPLETGYSRCITYNDGVFEGIMRLLRDVKDRAPQYAFVDDNKRKELAAAYDKGLECILATQINDAGRPTAWCQQYDEVSLQPAWARKFEPPSICNKESVGIVLFLMSIDHPDKAITDAVQNAVTWFQESRIFNTRIKTIPAPRMVTPFRVSVSDKVVVTDSTAPPIWTRYYELKTHRPLFCNRDSKPVYSLAEVARERRDGYGWYTYDPQQVLDKYPGWRQKWLPAAAAAQNYSWDHLPEVQRPAFKKDTVTITAYGARPDGITLNTRAINEAITECSRKGGGVVLVPQGLWLTGPIVLKSNVDLHIDRAAILQFTTDFDQYPIVAGNWEGHPAARCQSPLSATDQENIAITGTGIIDGNGDAWRWIAKDRLTEGEWKKKVSSGGVVTEDGKTWFPSAKSLKGYRTKEAGVLRPGQSPSSFEDIRDFLRPNLLVLTNCKKVLLDGPSFQNSPAWCLHTLLCEQLTVHDVHVRNPWYAANGDGIDIESCKNVLLENSTFDAGDDGICIKSGRDGEGRKRGKPTENVIVRNNIVYHAHGGFVIGSEMSGGARNIFVYNCSFQGTDIGLRFKTVRGRGGMVEKIYVKNISMKDIEHQAVFLDMYYFAKPAPLSATYGKAAEELPPVTEATPQFRDIHISNVVCDGAEEGIFIRGLPEMSIRDIYLENMVLKAAKGVELTAAQHISLKNIRLITTGASAPSTDVGPIPVIYIENSSDLSFDNIQYDPGSAILFSINGDKNAGIRVLHTDVTKAARPAIFNYGAKELNFTIVGGSDR